MLHCITADFNAVHCYDVPFTAQQSFLKPTGLTGGYTTRLEYHTCSTHMDSTVQCEQRRQTTWLKTSLPKKNILK